ncbi:efflux RND transporter periplasmic adaptor subunit [Phormidium sp. LEGE 05292]|uniref:HlyD family secretion protein n=1 Tax=[Phormidium] sp. LEGE 05292 TaxID=767427 RepID=UPI00187E38B8|nr:HlyD family efflux transporter periplasmic adaptor subunit [Phormidium sp. LEGE 05292]MBE9228226.1 efflux RND transporter periplasmic adaptor subunit [Phormidium sp. LEGE 05292]
MTQISSQPNQFVPDAQEKSKPERKFKPGLLRIPLVLLIVGGVGFFSWNYFSRPQKEGLELSGRIEGYPTDIGAKVGGKISLVTVREGDRVNQGDVIVRLDDAEIQAQLRGAAAKITAAEQQKQQVLSHIEVINSQIQEAQLNMQQAMGDAKGRIFQAESNLAAAQAQVSQAEAIVNQAKAEVIRAQTQVDQAKSQLKLARMNRDRYAQLYKEGAFSKQVFDEAQTKFETAQATYENAVAGLDTSQATLASRKAAVDAAKRQVNAAQGGLLQAQTTSINPDIRNAQVNALRRQLNVDKAQLAAAEAEVKNAQATQQEIQAQMSYLNVVSPISGVVITRSVEPGEVIATGKTLLTVLNPDSVYLRGFVPEGKIGQVRVGQNAKVFLDSAPKQPLNAHVAAIDTQASFTPENIYFKDDQVKQVFGVKLALDNPQGFAKPGMPADAEIIPEQKSSTNSTQLKGKD